jgi:hypothetical protein
MKVVVDFGRGRGFVGAWIFESWLWILVVDFVCHPKVVVKFAVDFAVDFGVDFVCEVFWSRNGGVKFAVDFVFRTPVLHLVDFAVDFILVLKQTQIKSTPNFTGVLFNRSRRGAWQRSQRPNFTHTLPDTLPEPPP